MSLESVSRSEAGKPEFLMPRDDFNLFAFDSNAFVKAEIRDRVSEQQKEAHEGAYFSASWKACNLWKVESISGCEAGERRTDLNLNSLVS